MSGETPPKKIETRGVLYPVDQSQVTEPIKLKRDATILGREKGDVLISDQEVSSTHCQIQNINGVFHIFDMNSTNGTFVNKNRVIKSKLNHGDEVTIGKTVFRFTVEEDAKVRHIHTIFKGQQNASSQHKSSLVDTLIEDEVRKKLSYSLLIKVKYSDGSRDQFELPQRMVYLGRATSFGRFESDAEISRKHLLIKLNNHGEVFIEDQGSTNGTYLNGNRIGGMVPVKPGDTIKMGGIELSVTVKTG